jgi:hypothetical protein
MTVRGSELRDLVGVGVLDSTDLIPLGGEAVKLEGSTVDDKIGESHSASESESALIEENSHPNGERVLHEGVGKPDFFRAVLSSG